MTENFYYHCINCLNEMVNELNVTREQLLCVDFLYNIDMT